MPSDFSAAIARNTQLYLQNDIGLTQSIDPWGGSHYVESLTAQLANQAWTLIEEVESEGGMTRAIEAGIPKMRIEEAAAKKQARIDTGEDIITGVNAYLPEAQTDLNLLEVDNTAVRQAQIEHIQAIKATRDAEQVKQRLIAIEENAQNGTGNLLHLSIEAARARATLGEISMALERAFGRYQPRTHIIDGVYGQSMKEDTTYNEARARSDNFAAQEGRRPRIMIAKIGQDGHDRGAKVIATSFSDLGFDVDIGPLFQLPEEAAQQAVENDVHVLGISTLAAGHKTLVPEVIRSLKEYDREDILVVVGGVIPPDDYPILFDMGVGAVFGPGTIISSAAIEILDRLESMHA